MTVREAAKPSLLRAINLRATFELVHATGPIAAPHVVRDTGLSKPTVSEVLTQLLDQGLLRKVGRTSGLPGPSAQLYDVNPRAGWVLSLDIGHEWVRSELVDLTGRPAGSAATRTRRSARSVIAQMRRAAEDLTAKAGIGLADVRQVVVGTPGVMRPGEDHLSLAPQLPGWEKPNVISAIREALVGPVIFENDVNLAAVGEQATGIARGSDDFVLISVGTGVGMAAVVDGALRRGAAGLAGEIGYLPTTMTATRRRPQRGVWRTGGFERLVSSAAVIAQAQERGLTNVHTAEAVFAAARAGDSRAQRVIDTEAQRLAHGIAAIAAVLDPELVVLGGGIGSGGGDLLLGLIEEWLATISPFSPRLAVSTLGANAVIAGANAIGLRLAFDSIFGADPPVARSPIDLSQARMSLRGTRVTADEGATAGVEVPA
jgi:predicted NBD/HSP70 family sugar kinase